ncbi:hypothetical protein EDD86DRAFT_196921 [Gorgonomyces haynaldii]|nr:hypothetical protein EDD86DRAFT_196921 [Gorgonomyces haynaldii]
MATLPPLPSKLDENSASGQDVSNVLPASKANAYVAIFEDALEQLSVLADITPEAMKTDNKMLAEKVTKILNEQRELQEKYQELLVERDGKASVKGKTRELQQALQEITSQLQASTVTLARLLKTHPSVAQNLLKIQQERTALQALIARSIKEFKVCRFDSLIQMVEEEYKKRNTLQNTINKESDASDMLKELLRELANEKKLIQDELHDRNEVIQQLKDTIQEINALTVSEQKYIKKEVKAHENSVKLTCQHKESMLTAEKQLLEKKLEQENLAHDKIMSFLADQRGQLEMSIQDWMSKYEEDTESKSLELETLKQKRTQDLDKFEELVTAYENLEKVVDDDKAVRAAELEEQRMQMKRESAAIQIQRWYRKFKAIKVAEAAAKAPAAKKGKGKKKK